jgi:hypothetical protein
MGVLRGIAKGVVGIIFLLLLAGLLMNITFYETTKSDFIRPVLTEALANSLESQNITPTFNDALEKCKTQSSYSPPVGNFNISMDCSKIKSSNQSGFAKLIIENLFDQQIYNRQCSGIDCLKLQDIPGIITNAFNNFLKTTLIILAGGAILFGLLLFLLSKGLQSKLSSLGTPFILTGISAIPLYIYKSRISAGTFQVFIDKIIEVILKYCLISLAIGIILVIAGIVIAMKNKKSKKDKKKKK